MNQPNKLIVCMGLPASGKSTYAKKLIIDSPDTYVRINFDELRETLFCGIWSKDKEFMLRELADSIVDIVFLEGKIAILDNTNITKPQQSMIESIKAFHGDNVEIEYVSFFDVPIEDLIERDIKREKSVGKDVIMRLYNTAKKNADLIYQNTGGKVDIRGI